MCRGILSSYHYLIYESHADHSTQLFEGRWSCILDSTIPTTSSQRPNEEDRGRSRLAMGSDWLINKYDVPTAAPYSVSKGALNTAYCEVQRRSQEGGYLYVLPYHLALLLRI